MSQIKKLSQYVKDNGQIVKDNQGKRIGLTTNLKLNSITTVTNIFVDQWETLKYIYVIDGYVGKVRNVKEETASEILSLLKNS